MMGVCCVQLLSAGRGVTGLRYWFVFGEMCWCDRLAFCANTAQDLALLFFSGLMASVRCVSRTVLIILTFFRGFFGMQQEGALRYSSV